MSDMEKLYGEIYAAYKDKVSRYVHGKISNYHDAEDLVSDVFLKVCQKYGTFDEKKASLSTWVYTLTRNTVIDFYRQSKEYCSGSGEFPANGGFDETQIGEERLERLADALSRIGQRNRDIIILHYYNGYTLKEVAEKMNLSYSNVKLLHGKALKKLQILL